MFDIKDWIPVEAFAPFIAGVLIWFGVNYTFLAPDVIGPRLSEKYYVPVCEANVAKVAEGFKTELAAKVQTFESGLAQRQQKTRQAIQQQLDGIFSPYGAEGKAIGNLFGLNSQNYESAIAMESDNQRGSFSGEVQKEIEKQRASQKHETPAAFCGCNVSEAMSERLELSLFTTSFRLYKPRMISQLEDGTFFEACGAAPVV